MINNETSPVERIWDEREFLQRLKDGAITLQPLCLQFVSQEAALSSRPSGTRADGLLEVEWQGHSARFAIEYKRLSTPKSLNTAVIQARAYAATSKLLPMIILPFLS